jgi:hypothetical protein
MMTLKKLELFLYFNYFQRVLCLCSQQVSTTPFFWTKLQNTVGNMQVLQFGYKNNVAKEPYYLKAVGEIVQVYFEGTTMRTMHSCIFDINLRPVFILKNLLPVYLVYVSERGTELNIQPGGSIHLPAIDPVKSLIHLRVI